MGKANGQPMKELFRNSHLGEKSSEGWEGDKSLLFKGGKGNTISQKRKIPLTLIKEKMPQSKCERKGGKVQ